MRAAATGTHDVAPHASRGGAAARGRAGTSSASRREIGLVVVVSAVFVGAPALPAFAHNSPVGSTPAEGEVVTTQPEVIALETSDELLDLGDGTAMQVQGPDGLYYGDGCAEVVGVSAETRAQLGAPGEYTVTWRVVSTDGHPITGSWSFEWQPAAGAELATGADAAPTCGGPPASASDGDAQAGDADEATDAAAESIPADVLWIGAAVLAVGAAALATWLVVRRRA